MTHTTMQTTHSHHKTKPFLQIHNNNKMTPHSQIARFLLLAATFANVTTALGGERAFHDIYQMDPVAPADRLSSVVIENEINFWNWLRPYSPRVWLATIMAILVSGVVYQILEWYADDRQERSMWEGWLENAYMSACRGRVLKAGGKGAAGGAVAAASAAAGGAKSAAFGSIPLSSTRIAMTPWKIVLVALFVSLPGQCDAFTIGPPSSRVGRSVGVDSLVSLRAEGSASSSSDAEDEAFATEVEQMEQEEKERVVGNLVANDEWSGLSMELSELVRTAIVEDMKDKTRDFLGKDDYKMGDLSKEVDSRVKDEVAKMRGKEEYELGDFTVAMDEMAKSLTEELTGKEYETGDLSREIDRRVKDKVAEFAGKEEYEFGDLSKEIDRRVKNRVMEFTGNSEYKFGDLTREIMSRNKDQMKEFLGEEGMKNYQFGDITKALGRKYTGDDDYQFGDITKKALGNIFGGKKGKK